jgi:crotonobetainyl-CoA:carnitine CoA-transferase CaiB-like acyl-CoA transferase
MADDRVAELLADVGLPADVAHIVTIEGSDPVYASPIPVASSAAVALGAVAATAGLIWREKTGVDQTVTVDTRRAGASLLSFVFQHLSDAETPQRIADNPLIALYECRDGRWVHLHGAFPRLADPTRRVLGLSEGADSAAVAASVARWEAPALEDALAEERTCGAMVRTRDEWAGHTQGRAVGALARVQIEKIGESAPEPVGGTDRPLDGVRVLDLTRILAGPTNGRTLAEHGADVLLVNSPNLDNVLPFVIDTSHGKRSTFLDLDSPDDHARLLALASSADVFAQGYRGGAMQRRGLGPDELAARRPGIVYVSMSCYGDVGPWQERPGWEQLAQTVTGIAAAHGAMGDPHRGADGAPVLIPAAACDYTTGSLAALGTMVALWRRSHEGGSYHVRASLCQTGMWFAREPRVDRDAASGFGDVAPFLTTTDTAFGRLRHLAPVAQMSATPPHWELPTSPLGAHPPDWSSANSRAAAGK